ncbi:MAG: hypothetical protein HDS68_00100 [Bacteroidales bacterium]|nr:hypothetical protein [Bacteroidales bacterium]
MNKITLTVCLLLSAIVAAASELALPDTIKVIHKAERISVIERPDGATISAVSVNNNGERYEYEYDVTIDRNDISNKIVDINMPFLALFGCDNCAPTSRRNTISRAVTGMKGIYWGWNFNYADKSDLKNCFEVGILELIGIGWSRGYRKPSFDIGLGFGMRRYLAGKGVSFSRDANELTFSRDLPQEDMHLTRARMDMWTFHIPMLYTQPLGKKVNFVLGAIVNFNTYTKAWNRWECGDRMYSETIKGYEQRLLTADIIGSLSLHNSLGIYARWSPISSYCADKGPSVRSWSIGVSIGF